MAKKAQCILQKCLQGIFCHDKPKKSATRQTALYYYLSRIAKTKKSGFTWLSNAERARHSSFGEKATAKLQCKAKNDSRDHSGLP